MLYAKYARGYRSGSINTGVPPSIAVIEPEKVNSYETGFKSNFSGPIHGSFDVSFFYNDLTNQQLRQSFINVSNNATLPATVNAGQSRIYGAEIEFSISPLTGLRIDGSYAYLNGKITSVNFPSLPANSPVVPIGGFQTGDELVNTPMNKADLSSAYSLPLNPDIGTISFGPTVVYVDTQVSNGGVRNTAGQICCVSVLPSYTLLNVNASWNSIFRSSVDLSLFATNVTNKEYVTYGQAFGISPLGFDSRQLGQPRMYGATLRYSFK
jgi:iron complex outermembrane receptor protein